MATKDPRPLYDVLPTVHDGGYPRPGNEIRVVNETTGAEKGQKDARFDLIPWDQVWKVAELYGKGAKKYEARNWEKGYDWSLSFAALHRHLAQFWGGQSYDDETGAHHLASVIFHALAMMEFEETHPELDDRPKVHNESN